MLIEPLRRRKLLKALVATRNEWTDSGHFDSLVFLPLSPLYDMRMLVDSNYIQYTSNSIHHISPNDYVTRRFLFAHKLLSLPLTPITPQHVKP